MSNNPVEILKNMGSTSRKVLEYLLIHGYGNYVKPKEICEALKISPQNLTNIGKKFERIGILIRDRNRGYTLNIGYFVFMLFEVLLQLLEKSSP